MDDQNEPYPPDADDEAVPVQRYKKARQAGVLQRPAKARHKKPPSLGKSGNRILAQQKRRQALEFRKAGMTYQDIAQQVGYSDASGARKAVVKAFGEIIQEPVSELRSIQMERLNHMLLTLWGKVQAGDESAINTALRIMDKMDALAGTEAAKQMEVRSTSQSAVLVIDGNEDDYTTALKRMAGMGIGADGKNLTAQQVPQGQNYPPGMQPKKTPELAPASTAVETLVENDVVDGEFIEDSLADHLGPDGVAAVKGIMAQPLDGEQIEKDREAAAQGVETKRRYSFGVEPTVRRKR